MITVIVLNFFKNDILVEICNEKIFEARCVLRNLTISDTALQIKIIHYQRFTGNLYVSFDKE